MTLKDKTKRLLIIDRASAYILDCIRIGFEDKIRDLQESLNIYKYNTTDDNLNDLKLKFEILARFHSDSKKVS